MKGKYNSANIFIDEIDETTKNQIQTFLNHPAFANSYIAIMPDCHAGIGAVVGFTMKANDYYIPNVIGVDIGCGMLSANLGKIKIGSNQIMDLQHVDDFIKAKIPSGFHLNEDFFYDQTNGCDMSFITRVKDLCETMKIDHVKALRAIGSLGGGNHFIEFGYSNIEKDLWITVHTGSRNFGKCVAEFYQKKAKEIMLKNFVDVREFKNLEFLLRSHHVTSQYVAATALAQDFARRNRKEIMNRLCAYIGDPIKMIESIHNYIDFDDYIVRKGATPARKGQDVIIPFNMRDGIAICKGLGNDKYNQSAPHGAGRILSRTQAKANLKLEDFQNQMKGIFTSTANINTLDEAPDAYKNMQIILDNIKETVNVIDFIKPIYNFKAENER
jgi:RNA-splicing ligase RtcB